MLARASTSVAGTPAQAEALWVEPARWPAWVDGFGHVASIKGGWPEPGAVLLWDSKPGGRGRVREKVAGRRPGAELVLEVEDERLEATQTVTFERQEERTVVRLTSDYRLKDRTPLTPLVDRFFVRRAMTASLQRTLERFAVERTADAEMS